MNPMRYVLLFSALLLAACDTATGPGSPIVPPPLLGYSLGLGCQGACLPGGGAATEILVGDTAGAVQGGSILTFDATRTRHVFIPDSLRLAYWTNTSFRAAIRKSDVATLRFVTLPDHPLYLRADSCLTWDQSAFQPDTVPCLPVLLLQ